MRDVTLENVRTARSCIDPAFLTSPVVRSQAFARATGLDLSMKVECLNPIRSFKGRGAEFLLSATPEADRLVCASAGNFGQAMAWACRRRGRRITVYAATSAVQTKIDAMRLLGAHVVLEGADFDAPKDGARRHALASGTRYIEDGALPEIAEGAGTLALELIEAGVDADAVLLPLGNGALAHGVATVYRALAPATRIICVTAARAPAMKLSLAARRPLPAADASTIADGIAVRVPVPYAVDALASLVDEVVEVAEETFADAVRLLHETLGLVVEPAGAAGVAAAIAAPSRWQGQRLVTVLCGSNVDPRWLHRCLAGPAGLAGSRRRTRP